jgi:threonine efflux protein
MTAMEIMSGLIPVYVAYLAATISPGPSNMAIMSVAMSMGRKPALALAAGVVTGSMSLALLAATGLSTILAAYADALFLIRIAGGLYLLYWALRFMKAASSATVMGAQDVGDRAARPYLSLYRWGLLTHLGNPKAILAWIAIMSLGLRPDGPSHALAVIVAGCAVLGILVFCGYALVFSTAPIIRIYGRLRRWLEGMFALFFGVCGIQLLLTRV